MKYTQTPSSEIQFVWFGEGPEVAVFNATQVQLGLSTKLQEWNYAKNV